MASDTIKPTCDLADTAGDAFATIVAVAKVLDDSGQRKSGDAFWASAMRFKDDYAKVLTLAKVYVEVRT